ncbi:MAG: hypothetical protein KDC93_18485, partial [Cyclobacteriaceae bacterium]|nr:hypothetical protein [Cyclobacteriaceae bacterium]
MKGIPLKRNYLLPVLLVLFAFGASNVKAQSTVKINILSPIVKTLNLQYEKVLNESSSFQLGF